MARSDEEIGKEASSAARTITVKAYAKLGYTADSYAEGMVSLTKAKFIYKGEETDHPDNKIILPATKQIGADLGLQAPREQTVTIDYKDLPDEEIARRLVELRSKVEKGESPEEG